MKAKRYGVALSLVAALVIAIWYGVQALSRERAREHAASGVQHLGAGNVAQAETEILRGAQLAPDETAVQRAVGRLRLAQGRLPEARDAFRRLTDLHPGAPHTLCEIAAAELRSRELTLLRAAAEDGARAADLEPHCLRAQRTAGEALIAKGDTRRGIDYLRRAAELDPSDMALAFALYQQFLGAQRLKEATALAVELTRRFPNEAQAFAVLGLSYQLHPPQTSEARKAPQLLRQALRLDPRNVVALAQLGHYHLLRGEVPVAIGRLEAARSVDPNRHSVLFDLSRAYRLAGRGAEAEATLRRFTQLSNRAAEIGRLRRRRLLEPDNPELARRLHALEMADESARQAGPAAGSSPDPSPVRH